MSEDPHQDFEFSQDINFTENKRSKYLKNYTKNIKKKLKPFHKIIPQVYFSKFMQHETFGDGKIIHIDGNKLLINFKSSGEKKVIDKYLKKIANE